jgi:hypothetical protein
VIGMKHQPIDLVLERAGALAGDVVSGRRVACWQRDPDPIEVFPQARLDLESRRAVAEALVRGMYCQWPRDDAADRRREVLTQRAVIDLYCRGAGPWC